MDTSAYYHDKYVQTLRTTAILTSAAYVVCNNVVDNSDENFNTLTLNLNFKIESATSLNWKLEFSDDNVTYGVQKLEGTSSPTTTLVDHNYNTAVGGLNTHTIKIRHKYVRVSVQGVGNMTDTDLIITSKLTNE